MSQTMKPKTCLPFFISIGFALLVLIEIAGCGRSLPPPSDSSLAHDAMLKSLDTWRNSGSVESLRTASPAIYFNEPRFDGVTRLVDYRIESERANGLSWVCEVALTLQTDRGETVTGQTGYCIDTGAAIVIVPQTST